MGLLDKLFKKGPKADEVSKGGSPIYRYEDKENEGCCFLMYMFLSALRHVL